MEKRNKYVKLMMKENMARECKVLYIDEIYIHKNYCRHEDSLYDPNDKQYLTTIVHHKGKRYCFIPVVVNMDHSVPELYFKDAQKAGLLHDTLDIFEGERKQKKDYHGMFNHAYCV